MIRIVALGAPPEPDLLETVRVLVGEYAAMPHAKVLWTTAAADIAALPHPFVPPRGAQLLAYDDDAPLGCGALVPTADATVTELKRVYVRPSARGRGVGETLMHALMAHAVTLGYRRAILDTARDLLAAQALYRRLGFTEIPQFRAANGDTTICFGIDLPIARPPGFTCL